MSKPRMDDEYDDDPKCVGVGFIQTSNGKTQSPQHEHSFEQVQPHRMFAKQGLTGVKFSTLYCECGVTAEIIAEDKRPLNKDERKQLGLK